LYGAWSYKIAYSHYFGQRPTPSLLHTAHRDKWTTITTRNGCVAA
jgi:hypothetical protein